MNQLRLMIVDDDPLVRRGLKAIFELDDEIRIVGEASNGHEALELVPSLKPDLVLMDINMPRMDGIEATRRLKLMLPDLQVVALTVRNQEENVLQAIRSGSAGYLLKDTPPGELIDVVKKVAGGQKYFDASLAGSLLIKLVKGSPMRGQEGPGLTAREYEVLNLIVEGYSNKEISAHLNISLRTVKAHVSNILQKLGVDDRTQAAVLAVEQHLVTYRTGGDGKS